MRPLGLTARVAPLVLLAGLALAGCGGGDDADADPQAAPSRSAASEPPSAEPSPTPSGPDRSPEALAALLEFTAPDFDEPTVQEAVDDYEEYLRQYMVAQGLPDADYPPMIAGLDPAFAEAALVQTVQLEEGGYFAAGPYVETVVDGAGSQGEVFITSCADLSGREFYDVKTGKLVKAAEAVETPVTVTMTRGAERWVLSAYDRNESLVCP